MKAKWLCLRITHQDPSSAHDAGFSFSILILRNLCSEVLETWQFVVLVNDSHIGGLNSITIRMEYFLLFKFDYLNLVWKNDDGEAGSIILLIFYPLRKL